MLSISIHPVNPEPTGDFLSDVPGALFYLAVGLLITASCFVGKSVRTDQDVEGRGLRGGVELIKHCVFTPRCGSSH